LTANSAIERIELHPQPEVGCEVLG
jgi:hypothetical protein